LLLGAATLAARLSSQTSDLGHVFPISTNRDATLPSSFASLFGRKLMRVSSFMSYLSPFACYLALLFSVHSRKSP
jgi:hypothetical protein